MVAIAKIGTNDEDTATLLKQKGEKRFLVTVGSHTGLVVLVDKEPGTLAAGEMVVKVENADGDTFNVVKLYNRTAILSDGSHHAWDFTNAVDEKVQMIDTVEAPTPVITITAQPASQTFNPGDELSFTVTASSSSGKPLTFTWQYATGGSSTFSDVDFGNLLGSGGTSILGNVSTETESNGLQIRCVVSSEGAADVVSDVATLTLLAPVITITGQPTAQESYDIGSSANFFISASVTGGATLSYQWQTAPSGSSTFTDIDEATDTEYTTHQLTSDDDGVQLRCVVSATGGAESVTSNEVTIHMPATPVITITSQPESAEVDEGAPVEFSVTASVTEGATLSYNWQSRLGEGIYMDTGGTEATYSIAGVSADNSGTVFRCIVSATGGAANVTSDEATLTVDPAP